MKIRRLTAEYDAPVCTCKLKLFTWALQYAASLAKPLCAYRWASEARLDALDVTSRLAGSASAPDQSCSESTD